MVRLHLDTGGAHRHIVLDHVLTDGTLRAATPRPAGIYEQHTQLMARPSSARPALSLPPQPTSRPGSAIRPGMRVRELNKRPVSAHALSRHRPLSARSPFASEGRGGGNAAGILGPLGGLAISGGSTLAATPPHPGSLLEQVLASSSASDRVSGAVSMARPTDSWALTGMDDAAVLPGSSRSEARTVEGGTPAAVSVPSQPSSPRSLSSSPRRSSTLRASRLKDKAAEDAGEGAAPSPSALPPMEVRSARTRAKEALSAMLELSAESYVELAFDATSGAYQYEDEQLAAAKVFDQRHVALTGAARRHLVHLEYDPTARSVDASYKAQIGYVRRNRYFVPEAVGAVRAIKAKRKRKPRWRLETSCWAARLTHGNSKDFFETPQAMHRLFMADWAIAQRSHELAYYIVKCHHDPTTWRDIDKNGVHDEVDEVREALWQHHRVLYGAFDYYSTLYSDNENSLGEPDVFNMSFTAYMAMVASGATAHHAQLPVHAQCSAHRTPLRRLPS